MTITIHPRLLSVVLSTLLVVSTFGVGATLQGTAAAADGTAPDEITACTVVDRPGTYVLASDLRSSDDACITITADDVVLDGQGHVVDGVDGSSAGKHSGRSGIVVVDPEAPKGEAGVGPTNVTIRNVVVREWGHGLTVAAGSDVVLDGVTATNNRVGVKFGGVVDGTVENSAFVGNAQHGVRTRESTRVAVTDSVVSDNGAFGFHVAGVTDLRIERNTVAGNGGGVDVKLSTGVVVADNVVTGNADSGIGLKSVAGATVRGNDVSGGAVGIAVGVEGTDDHDDGGAEDDHDHDVTVTPGNVVLAANVVTGASAHGIALGDAGDVTLSDTVVGNSGEWDVHAQTGASSVTADRVSLDGTTVSFTGTDVALRGVARPAALPAGYVDAGVAVETASLGDGSSLDLRVHYDDAAVGGDESSLSLWVDDGAWTQLPGTNDYEYDAGAEAWTRFGRNGVDTGGNVVFADVTTHGVVVPLASIEPVGTPDVTVREATLASNPVATGETVTVIATVANDGTGAGDVRVHLLVDGTPVDSRLLSLAANDTATVEFDASFDAVGDYAVAVSDATAGTLSVVDVTPPTAVASVSDDVVRPGVTVTLDGTASSDDEGVVAYAWDFGDGTNATGVTAVHAYAEAGTYTVTLTATDAAGNAATDALTVLVDGTAPHVDAGPNARTLVGADVWFSGAGVSDDDAVARYHWDFGDGYDATGRNAIHTYTHAATYTVTLTVTDRAGNSASDTKTVTVRERTRPSGATGGTATPPSDGTTTPPSGGDPVRNQTRVMTQRLDDGSFQIRIQDAVRDRVHVANATWSRPDPATGIQLHTLGIEVAEDGNYTLRVRTTERVTAGTPAFDEADGRRVFGYLTVEADRPADAIGPVTFEYRLRKATMERFGVGADRVALYRYHDGVWTRLQTRVTAETQTQYQFRADSPGTSAFAVVGDAPDVRVTDVTVDRTAVDVGETVTVTASLENAGLVDGEYEVTLRVDGDRVATETVAVPAGEATTVSLSHAFETAGDHRLALGETEVRVSVTEETTTPAAGTTSDAPGTTEGSVDAPGTRGGPTSEEGPAPGFTAAFAVLALLATLAFALRGRR